MRASLRTLLAAAVTLAWATAAAAQAPPPPALDLSGAEVKAFIDRLPKDRVSDLPIRVTDVGGYKVGIYGVFRPKTQPGDANVHETTVTEIHDMLEGTGTLVTGRTLVNPRSAGVRPNTGKPNMRGTAIAGGTSRRVGPGDIIVIPGRLPHWFSSLDSDIRYVIYRPDPQGLQPLKVARHDRRRTGAAESLARLDSWAHRLQTSKAVSREAHRNSLTSSTECLAGRAVERIGEGAPASPTLSVIATCASTSVSSPGRMSRCTTRAPSATTETQQSPVVRSSSRSDGALYVVGSRGERDLRHTIGLVDSRRVIQAFRLGGVKRHPSRRCLPQDPLPLHGQHRPDHDSDGCHQHGQQRQSQAKPGLQIGRVISRRFDRWLSLEFRQGPAGEFMSVQAHLDCESLHVGPPEHACGQASEVVALDGAKRGRRDLGCVRNIPKAQPSLFAGQPEPGTDVGSVLVHVETSRLMTPKW